MAKLVDMSPSPKTPATIETRPYINSDMSWYGGCISLSDEEMKKLGLDGDRPSAGDSIHFEAVAKVTSVSENERTDGAGGPVKCCRVELQITHMGIPGNSEPRADKWYGSEPDGDED